jgi:outer membrane lipoprotein-sorting protein
MTIIRLQIVAAALAFAGVGTAIIIAPAAAAAQTIQAPDPALAQISRHLRALSTLTARFTQTDRNGQVQTGTLTLKQPGKIRFQYDPGVPLLIVADGNWLTMIDYEVRQVQRWPIRNSPLGALLDPSRDLTRYGRMVPTADPDVLMVEVRDPKHPEYGTLSMVFRRKAGAPAGLELYGWVARDAQSNRTSIRLTDHVYGAPVADSAFRWRDPRPASPRGR